MSYVHYNATTQVLDDSIVYPVIPGTDGLFPEAVLAPGAAWTAVSDPAVGAALQARQAQQARQRQTVATLTTACLAALDLLDQKSVRPSRSIKVAELAGETPNSGDVAKLTSLETQATAYRTILAQLAAGIDPTTITLPSLA